MNLSSASTSSACDYPYERLLGDGRAIWCYERMFNSIVMIGTVGSLMYESHWCYETLEQAIDAAEKWDPLTQKEPEGWFRHAMSGRRRPGGDPSKEYIEH
jgi:hypothetical protein